MIPVKRGPEPAKLVEVRTKQLAFLQSLKRAPTAKQIDGYRVVASELAQAQHYKCCYCEFRIRETYNDVEHYRPKTEAIRTPGSNETHGYWWLAFSWENLLFACPDCNRSAKKAHFPLAAGSTALQPGQQPPGGEIALLLDPAAGINPAEHIEYVHELAGVGQTRHWYARPRHGSVQGSYTIEVCKLNQQVLLQSRDMHIADFVQREIGYLSQILKKGRKADKQYEFERACCLFQPNMPYSVLSYDALRHHFPDTILQKAIGQSWPQPAAIGMP